jgi:alkaline phosphatase
MMRNKSAALVLILSLVLLVTSAWACGEKFNNREVSCLSDQSLPSYDRVCLPGIRPTALEVAAAKGMATGLVASSQISHATPAAFGSHVHTRYCGAEIARQFIEDTEVDVILGGGVYKTGNDWNCESYGESFYYDQDDIIDLALDNGYVSVGTENQLQTAIDSGEARILGLFRPYKSGKTVEAFRLNPFVDTPYPDYPEGEPTLPQMTRAALDVLEQDNDGFFLVVEGSQIDWANHANDLHYQLAEMLAFDEAVGEVLDWIDEQPSRRKQTLLIVVPDHDTAGFAVNGPYGVLSEAGEFVDAGWTSGDHTAVDTLIWAQGPQAERLAGPCDNTDLYEVMLDALK